MNKIAVIDIGGTGIKHGIFDNGKLIDRSAFETPKTLLAFYDQLAHIVEKAKQKHQITGVGISIPGAVNKQSGIIGGASAIPYIHNFNIQVELEARFGLPITMENDANSAALAEITYGSAKRYKNVLFVVIGTGIGGAVVMDGKIQHGRHLLGGEFGFMLMDDEQHIFSEVGTAVGLANRYNQQKGTNYSGKEVFELANNGDAVAAKEVDYLFKMLAKGLYNLQYLFDPEQIILAGGISRATFLLPRLQHSFDGLKNELNNHFKAKFGTENFVTVMPEISVSDFKDDANLMGAAADFLQTHPQK